MKILMCHNYYQRRSGEDAVFEIEARQLSDMGHEVVTWTVDNQTIRQRNLLATGIGASWNRPSYQHVQNLIDTEQPDIAHFYNVFPLLSPAVFHAAANRGVPVVHSLHNYRLMCANAMFFRDGHPCEDCLTAKVPLNGILHACYRGSRLQSGAAALSLGVHRMLDTWKHKVDLLLLGSTPAMAEKFFAAGYPRGKLLLKPNFVEPDPGKGEGAGGYALFVGRFDPEKGVLDLLDAWRRLDSGRALRIVGEGPLAAQVREAAEANANIHWSGQQPLEELYKTMKQAAFLIFPSRWYEAMPRTILDSFSVGTPVLASRIGAMQDLVEEGVTGGFFEPANPPSLAAAAEQLFQHPERLQQMRTHARREFETKYTAEHNYRLLMQAYQLAQRPKAI
jgi:glycosyltransferase involved in cell wall biosynthesis